MTKFHFLVTFTLLGNMCIAIVCKPGCDIMNFEVNHIFPIKWFSLHDQKVLTTIR